MEAKKQPSPVETPTSSSTTHALPMSFSPSSSSSSSNLKNSLNENAQTGSNKRQKRLSENEQEQTLVMPSTSSNSNQDLNQSINSETRSTNAAVNPMSVSMNKSYSSSTSSASGFIKSNNKRTPKSPHTSVDSDTSSAVVRKPLTPKKKKKVKLESEMDSSLSSGANRRNEESSEADQLLQVPVDLLYMPKNCAEQVELFAKYVWESGWKAMPHHALPNWLRDNDFLLKGHRPPLPSVKACFKSIFRIHTETGNIWTHFIGAISFIAVAIYFWTRPSVEVQFQEKFIFGAFFVGAIICLVCSTLFHTLCCYSPQVSKIFNKIDYCGISVLTMGSFVPWLYYAFYCESWPKIIYLILMSVLGNACIVVSLWDKFSEPQFRAIRAGMFIALGLSGIIPAIHYILLYGSHKAFNVGALGWLILMAVLYIVGACLYACRIPERLFPGRFDIWFQSHQIFHIFVVAAAYVHYHGVTKLAMYRLTIGDCLSVNMEADFSFEF